MTNNLSEQDKLDLIKKRFDEAIQAQKDGTLIDGEAFFKQLSSDDVDHKENNCEQSRD
ncbi:hypothetical protein [Neptuniibacter sp.]|uniref:hypothetical protein n=1 Tax=Neptuniibacter sp. TaxID=1962643 RepID=UPI003B5C0827